MDEYASAPQLASDLFFLARELELSAPERLVLIALGHRLGRGHTMPTVVALCQDTGLSRGTVETAVRGLARRGLIVVEPRRKRLIYGLTKAAAEANNAEH